MINRSYKATKLMHAFKKGHLKLLFERERDVMALECKKKAKVKNNKKLYTKLKELTNEKIMAIIDPYFKLCQTIFIIKDSIYHAWQKNCKMQDVLDLFRGNLKFMKNQEFVIQALYYCFQGTDPDEPILGDLYPQKEKSTSSP